MAFSPAIGRSSAPLAAEEQTPRMAEAPGAGCKACRKVWSIDIVLVVCSVAAIVVAATADVGFRGHGRRPQTPVCTPVLGIYITLLFTLRPVHLRGMPLDMRTAPLFISLLLLVLGVQPVVFWKALIGIPELCPLKVTAIFFGMAYMGISLDETGVFRRVALQAAKRANSPKTVFAMVAALTAVITLLASNDVLVLTLTPIIVHLCAAKGYDPYPFLYLEYITCNVWSICLVIGNPTNIIVADPAGLGFGEYFVKFAPLGLICGVASVAVSYACFRSHLQTPEPAREQGSPTASRDMAEQQPQDEERQRRLERPRPEQQERPQKTRTLVCVLRLLALLVFSGLDSVTRVPLWASVAAASAASLLTDAGLDLARSDGVRDAARSTLRAMPWAVAPFVLGLFFMVEVLQDAGVVSALARGTRAMIGSSRPAASFGVGFASLLGCQILNNQPMTVLFTKVLIHPDFDTDEGTRRLAMKALIVGSNIGGNVTIVGALAGPMWADLLRRKGVKIGSAGFVSAMMRVTPAVALLAFSALLIL